MIADKISKCSSSIVYLAGDGNYTCIHFATNQRELYATTLSSFEKLLPGFVRIHKSYLVNPAYVTDYRSREFKSFDVLAGDEWLPVSRRRIDELESVLKWVEKMA